MGYRVGFQGMVLRSTVTGIVIVELNLSLYVYEIHLTPRVYAYMIRFS